MVMGPPSVASIPFRSNTPISTPNIPGMKIAIDKIPFRFIQCVYMLYLYVGMQTPRPAGTPGRPPLGSTGNSSNAVDERVDYDTLTDVMGYAGVDLKV
jgi:hypothetical protein